MPKKTELSIDIPMKEEDAPRYNPLIYIKNKTIGKFSLIALTILFESTIRLSLETRCESMLDNILTNPYTNKKVHGNRKIIYLYPHQ